MIFARLSPAARIADARIADALRVDHVDEAFDRAEANARAFGREVAAQIAKQYRAAAIDRDGIDQLVELALSQTAAKAAGVPRSMLKSILRTLHTTIRTDLDAVGIGIPDLPG